MEDKGIGADCTSTFSKKNYLLKKIYSQECFFINIQENLRYLAGFFLLIQMMLFTLLVNTLHCLFLILSQSEAGDMKTVGKMVAVSGVWMTLRVISHWLPWLVSSNPPVLSRSIPGGPATATQHS